jgi:TonB family protein
VSVEPIVQKIGRYVVLDEIGSGGMGVVYRAHDPALERAVAIKMLKHTGAGSDRAQFEKFFFRELKATASLQHKNIVTVFESGEQDGNPYLVMEYLKGMPVSRLIEERSTMPITEKLNIIVQVCEGLQYAHNRHPQIIHRDVKPANVILLADGVVKIVDFGIARVVGNESTIIPTGHLLGTIHYMSPEQINYAPIDARADIYSTGVLLYQLLTFALPFKGVDTRATLAKILREDPAPLSNFIDDVPPGLQDCASRAMAKDPDARYQSAEEFGFDLLQIQKNIRDRLTADLLLRAEAARQSGDLEKASVHLQEIIRLDRQHERANRLLPEVRKAIRTQQRAAQLVELLALARAALNARQFEHAAEYADHAMQLDPRREESIALCDEIAKASAQAKLAEEFLRRAAAALHAGDLDDAGRLVSSAITADPANLEARTMETVVEKQQAEHARHSQFQALLDQARRLITERKYLQAIDLLSKAKRLDPSDPRAMELLAIANQAQEQEQRQNDLQQITERVNDALRANDLRAACEICDLGLQRFPAEPALLRLKSVAENLQYTTQKRKYVQDQLFAARKLADSAKFEQAVELLTLALAKFPGEPSLIAAIADFRSEAEFRQGIEAEAIARSKYKLIVAGASLRDALDEREEIQRIEELAAPLKEMLGACSDPSLVATYGPLLKEASLRRELRDQALGCLESLLSTLRSRPAMSIAPHSAEVAQSSRTAFPKDQEIEEKSSRLLDLLTQRKAALERKSETFEVGSVPAVPLVAPEPPDPRRPPDTTEVFKRPAPEVPAFLLPEKRSLSFVAIALILAAIGVAVFAVRLFLRPAQRPTSSLAEGSGGSDQSKPPPGASHDTSGQTINGVLPPAVTSLSQTSIPAGSPGVKLTLEGSGFVAGQTRFLWSGSPRRAKVLNGNRLTAELSKSDVAVPKTASIAVQTPSGKSAELPFSVEAAAAIPAVPPAVVTPPKIISLSPASVPAGSPGFALTISMDGILPGKTRLSWNGVTRDTLSRNQATLPISAQDVMNPGQIPVTVSNPPYSTGSSFTLNFSVAKPIPKLPLLPAGTALSVALDKPLNSGTSHTGEPFSASLTGDVVLDGVTVLKAGSPVRGLVKFAKPKNFLRAGLLVITFTSIHVSGSDYAIRSSGIDSASGQKPQKASEYLSLLDNSVYPEKDSLKDSLKDAGVVPADAVFEGELRKDVQLSAELTFRLSAPLDFRPTGGDSAHLTPPPGPVGMAELGLGSFAGAPPAMGNLTISSGVMAGNLLTKTVPVYPAIAKAARVQGTVVLQATISKSGAVEDIRVLTGPPMLQKSALDAVKTWQYKPYLHEGRPVEVISTINVVFNLGDGNNAQAPPQ